MQSRTNVLLGFVRRCWHTYRWLSLGTLCIILAGTSGTLYALMAGHTSHPPFRATNTSAPGGATTGTSATPRVPGGTTAAPTNGTIPTQGSSTATPTPAPTSAQGLQLVYDDEFTSSSLSSMWVAWNRPGDSSNSEVECYVPGDVAMSGGSLALTAKVDSSCAGYRYTSGGVQWATKSFTYGTFEYRAKFAGGTGTWPAIWLLGANCQADQIIDSGNNCGWPNPGSEEIDITEVYSGSASNPKQNLITDTGNQSCMPDTSDVSQNWHTYDLVWQPGSLVWKVDGTVTCTFTDNVPSTPMFPIINVAVGGTGGGSVDPSTLPQTMYVDYVRLYQ